MATKLEIIAMIEKLVERLDDVDGRHPDTLKLINQAEDFIEEL